MFILDACNNIGMLKILMFIKIIMNIIFIIVPIGMIIMISIDFSKNIFNVEENNIKSNNKKIINRIISVILMFMVPYIINLVMHIIGNLDVYIAICYNNASKERIEEIAIANVEEIILTLNNKNEDLTSSDINNLETAIEYIDDDSIKNNYIDDLNNFKKKRQEQLASNNKSGNNSNNSNNNSKTSTKILIAAGHSYKPYCEQFSNECRGPANAGNSTSDSPYAEEDLTRELAKKIKKELIKLGYKNTNVDIANELLGENFNDHSTSKSLYGESVIKGKDGSKGSAAFRSINWKQYKYAIEIHFNGINSHNANGTVTLCKTCPGLTEKIDNDIRNEITSLLETKNYGYLNQSTSTISYFTSNGIPFTYLETEFYDNKPIIENYIAHSDEVAEIIAKNIKKYYP